MVFDKYNFYLRLFSDEEISFIKEIKLYHVILATTEMDWDDIPENVFRVPSSGKEFSYPFYFISKFNIHQNLTYHAHVLVVWLKTIV